jgi:hypothetical protein
MKKIISFTALLSILMLLSSCSSQEYNDKLAKGKDELNKEKYQEASKYFEEAKDAKETDEVNLLLKISTLMIDGETSLENGEFENSIFSYKKVISTSNSDSQVKDVVKKAKKLIEITNGKIEERDSFKNDIVKGKILLEEKKFDEAYKIFNIISSNKNVVTHKYYSNLRSEAINLMNHSVSLKEQYLKEQEKKKIEAEQKRKEEEERKKQEEEDNKKQQEEEKKKEEVKTNKVLSHEEAIELVKQYLNLPSNPNLRVEYDHDNDNGHYVIHVYEIVIDDANTMEGHTATWGWYGVDPNHSYVYDNMSF